MCPEDRQIVFSVIVPTYDRPAQLSRCLRALADLEYPREAFEVVVVDDGAAPGTQRIVETFSGELTVHLLSQPREGPASARNQGAARARGVYLAFTDDDCVPAPDWLRRLECCFTSHPTAAVGGVTINAIPAVHYSTASQLLIDYLYEYYKAEVTGARFFTSNNLALHAQGFREVGGFDESFPLPAAEDREFCERWQRSGRQLHYAEDVVVYHAHNLTLTSFVTQHFNYGRGADFLHRCRARYDGAGGRPKLEPLSFYFNLVRYPLTQRRRGRALPLVGLMALSQAAYGAGYFYERLRRAMSSDT
jgi:glycosyltransferase involved in cell wall biosynthesis